MTTRGSQSACSLIDACLIPFILYALLLPVHTFGQTILTGRITGPDGKTVPKASAHIVSSANSYPRPILETYPADGDGVFIAELGSGGLYYFWFTGELHDRYEIPILLEDGDSTDVNIVLQALPYSQSLDTLRVWTGTKANGRYSTDTLSIRSKLGDGHFELEFLAGADTVEYAIALTQLTVPTWGHGVQYDKLVLNRQGRYESYYYPLQTKATTIEIDTSLLGVGSTEPSYSFKHASSKTLKFASVYDDFGARRRRARDHTSQKRAEGLQYYEDGYAFDWRKDIRELDQLIRRERDSFTKQARYLIRMSAGLADEWLNYLPSRDFARDVLETIPPTSPLWSYDPIFFSICLRAATTPEKRYRELADDYIEIKDAASEYTVYVDAASHLHSDDAVRQSFLGAAISWAHRGKQFELFEKYYSEYLDLYAGTRGATNLQERYRPNKAITVGRELPDFEVASLDDRSEIISRESLLGKTYLMNFWATWCGPCIKKMEVLDKIQATYGSEAFTVFSVSINFSRDEALRFRTKSDWKMPWLNAHVDEWKAEKGILKDMEVVVIPKSILVGPDGTILAVDDGTDAFYDRIISVMGY